MELNLRTVLVILGALVMLGILVDGFRRMRRARQEALKLDVKGDFKFPEENFSSELPNGGARVIDDREEEELLEDVKNFHDQLNDLPVMSALEEIEERAEHELDADVKASLHEERIYAGEPDFQHESYIHEEAEIATLAEQNEHREKIQSHCEEASERILPKAKPLNLDENVPLLMDVEELGDDVAVHTANDFEEGIEQIKEASDTDANIEHVELTLGDVEGIQASMADINSLMAGEEVAIDKPVPLQEEARGPKVSEIGANEDGRLEVEDMLAQAAYAPVKKPGPNAENLALRDVASLVLVTHVVPHDEEGFCGEDILYLVNSCDLRHGEKDIFHRFEQENGEGRVQFSMANSFNPGTFDPQALMHERIHGISLFMSLPGPDKAMNAFEAMTEMASVIARNLGGDVHDETHSIMALQTIEHNRQQVRDFVRRQKLAGKK